MSTRNFQVVPAQMKNARKTRRARSFTRLPRFPDARSSGATNYALGSFLLRRKKNFAVPPTPKMIPTPTSTATKMRETSLNISVPFST